MLVYQAFGLTNNRVRELVTGPDSLMAGLCAGMGSGIGRALCIILQWGDFLCQTEQSHGVLAVLTLMRVISTCDGLERVLSCVQL